MAVSTDLIRELREKTNAPMMDCKKALVEANGGIKTAIEILKKRGQIVALKKAGRTAKEGIIESYIHSNNKIGVLLEVNCETDFVGRNEDFRKFVKDVCMQVAASTPAYVSREEVPKSTTDREKEILKEQVKGKPEKVMEKIVSGKLEKFYSEVCLLDQPFIKDDKLTIKDCLNTLIGKIGENIVIRRFVRFQVGEDIG
ncbi:MAG: translation elongation factor Ts [Candidatus Omnitrophica bacterium]|nr:translation elongation factor Ts [Candidatus Omnitrophota bacterium]MBU4458027.1 translation elongation factor Ts [Candidatus Omnitrophota bacterium]